MDSEDTTMAGTGADATGTEATEARAARDMSTASDEMDAAELMEEDNDAARLCDEDSRNEVPLKPDPRERDAETGAAEAGPAELDELDE